MTDRPDKAPPSLWTAVGPAFTALAMIFSLLDPERTGPAWVPALILVGSLALMAFVLLQRRRVTAEKR